MVLFFVDYEVCMLPWTDTSLQTRLVGKLPAVMALAVTIFAAYLMFLH